MQRPRGAQIVNLAQNRTRMGSISELGERQRYSRVAGDQSNGGKCV